MLRNEPDENNVNYQIIQWIQNDALQNITNSDLQKLVDYVAEDVRNEFHKLKTDKDSQSNLELLKLIMQYITLEKITWHFNIDSKTNQYSLTLSNMNEGVLGNNRIRLRKRT